MRKPSHAGPKTHNNARFLGELKTRTRVGSSDPVRPENYFVKRLVVNCVKTFCSPRRAILKPLTTSGNHLVSQSLPEKSPPLSTHWIDQGGHSCFHLILVKCSVGAACGQMEDGKHRVIGRISRHSGEGAAD